jgi:hypothetical protein
LPLAAFLALATAVQADSPDSPPLRRPLPTANPLHESVQQLLDHERDQLAVLQARLDAAPDADAALAIVRETEVLKLGTQVAVLELQLVWAQQQGQAEAVTRLEAVLARIPRPEQPSPAAAKPEAAPGAARQGG